MGILTDIQIYESEYSETSREKLTPEELVQVQSAVVTKSEFGNSICLNLVVGEGQKPKKAFLPLSKNSALSAGDEVDVKSIVMVTLTDGEQTIQRAEGSKAVRLFKKVVAAGA